LPLPSPDIAGPGQTPDIPHPMPKTAAPPMVRIFNLEGYIAQSSTEADQKAT